MDLQRKRAFLEMKKDELRVFLRSRGIVVSGESREELAERAYWAEKLGLKQKVGDKEAEEMIAKKKKRKLTLDGGLVQLPRPETLKGCTWEDSLVSIPSTTREQIDDYIRAAGRNLGLLNTKGTKTLALGKGLHLSQHVCNLSYNGISPNISYCYIRAKVIPQTKTNGEPYFTWIVLNKDNGQIITAECNCIVGIQGSCKHVTAVLFGVVEVVEKGKNVSVTSQKMTWNKGAAANKSTRQTEQFVDGIKFVKVKSDTSIQDLDQSHKTYRSSYDPRALVYRVPRPISDFDLDKLATITNGNTGLLMYHSRNSDPDRQSPNINEVAADVEVDTTCEPLTVKEAVSFVHSGVNADKIIIDKLSLTFEQQTVLANSTCKQASSPKWHEHRIGRVTASVASECAGKFINGNPPRLRPGHSCLAKVMGYYGNSVSPALQWGKNMEDVARKQYIAHHKLNYKHTCTCKDTGLWVSIKYPFIAGSPDGIVYCIKCESGIPGLLEIKNPYTHRNLTIRELLQQKESSGLVENHGKIRLSRSHKYFTQIQVQLHATDYTWCDFVVRTNAKRDNFHVERIYRDDKFLDSLFPKLEFFFSNAVVPEFLNPQVLDIVVGNAVRAVLSSIMDKLETAAAVTSSIAYPCGICGTLCEEDPSDVRYQSVGCDTCQLWHHYICVGLTGCEPFLKNRKSKWICATCKSSRKRRKTEN